jgi:hypothetical protein
MTRPIWLVVVALEGACGTTTTENVERELRATSLPATQSCKVEPPIAITLASRELERGRYELTATATPTKNVDSIDLAFVLPPSSTITRRAESFGATRSGESRTLIATITTSAPTSEISTFARFPFDGITMSRAATITVGDPLPTPRIRQYALPDGELAREVRP